MGKKNSEEKCLQRAPCVGELKTLTQKSRHGIDDPAASPSDISTMPGSNPKPRIWSSAGPERAAFQLSEATGNWDLEMRHPKTEDLVGSASVKARQHSLSRAPGAKFGNSDHVAAARRPSQCHRRRRASVLPTDPRQRGVIDNVAVVTPKRRIRHYRHCMFLTPRQDIALDMAIIEAVGDLIGDER